MSAPRPDFVLKILYRKNRKIRAQRVSLPHAEYSTAERPFARSNSTSSSAKNEFFAE
jgi:hypothetical protein